LNQEPRLLKKHANRRLYDTALKRYVSLDQIRELICEGVDVRVEDSRNGEDITRPILLQIMAECERDGRPMLSPEMLMSLIRHYGHPLQDLVGPFLEESLIFYTRQEARIRNALSGFAHLDGRENIAAMRKRFARMLGVGRSDMDSTED
jgi:polyhydroxyalkanoate synthesis repressor PhaR